MQLQRTPRPGPDQLPDSTAGLGRNMTIHVAVRRTEEPQGLLAATLDAVPSAVAVLDDMGSIRLANESWREFLKIFRIVIPRDGVGTSYLKAGIFGAIDPVHALELRVAIKQMLRGALDGFQRPVRLHGKGAEHWYQVNAARVRIDGTRQIVVTHADISAAHDAQETVKRLSQRLLSAQD